jgi:hypothetical protein
MLKHPLQLNAQVCVCILSCRYELLNTGTQKVEIKHLTSEDAKNESHFKVGPQGTAFCSVHNHFTWVLFVLFCSVLIVASLAARSV